MTRREHSRILAEGRIEKLNDLRNALIDTAHAVFEVLAYDDKHILDCKHQGPGVEDLEDAQRDKEATEQQLAAIRDVIAKLPDDAAELHRSIFVLPLEDRLRLIEDDISRIQKELEEKESEAAK